MCIKCWTYVMRICICKYFKCLFDSSLLNLDWKLNIQRNIYICICPGKTWSLSLSFIRFVSWSLLDAVLSSHSVLFSSVHVSMWYGDVCTLPPFSINCSFGNAIFQLSLLNVWPNSLIFHLFIMLILSCCLHVSSTHVKYMYTQRKKIHIKDTKIPLNGC